MWCKYHDGGHSGARRTRSSCPTNVRRPARHLTRVPRPGLEFHERVGLGADRCRRTIDSATLPATALRCCVKRTLTHIVVFLVFMANTGTLFAGCLCPPADMDRSHAHAAAPAGDVMPCHTDPAEPVAPPAAPVITACCDDPSLFAPAPRIDAADLPHPDWVVAPPSPEPPAVSAAGPATFAFVPAPPPHHRPFYLLECCFLN